MSELGIGVMLSRLGGNEETVKSVQSSIGKVIESIRLEPYTGNEPGYSKDRTDQDKLIIRFTDGSQLNIWDDGQSCCESRYMQSDDKPEDFIGSTLIGVELKAAPNIVDDPHNDGEHECQFLEIQTNKGQFVVVNHNSHNGYYGGFSMAAKLYL